jgi:hypothetical protein
MDAESAIRARFLSLEWALDERLRRLFAPSEANGRGGVTRVWKATGVARGSIQQGLKELVERPEAVERNARRTRRAGAGRKASVAVIVSVRGPGGPESPLRSTCKSLRQLASELTVQGYAVSPR